METECLFCPRSMKACPACGCKICSKHAASANGCCIKCVRAVQEAALAGRCTTAEEDAELEGIGGPDAALYGELTPIGFRTLAARLGLRESDVFVDLGSGLGRLAWQAAAEFGVKLAFGIELAASRHNLGVDALSAETDRDAASRVTLIQGDCADAALWTASSSPFARATVGYLGSLMFSTELMSTLARRIESCSFADLRVIATLKQWSAADAPSGFLLQEPAERCESSWTAPQALRDAREPGTPVFVYVAHGAK